MEATRYSAQRLDFSCIVGASADCRTVLLLQFFAYHLTQGHNFGVSDALPVHQYIIG